MIKLTQEELNEKLRLHKLWLEHKDGGEQFAGEYDLSDADLSYSNLDQADLRHTNLHHASLHSASLRYAMLRYTNLTNTNLHYADLRNADMSYADLRSASLYNASLRDASLYSANLYNTELCDADLFDARLSGANLRNANLRYAKNIPHVPIACPSHGAFTAWKKVGDIYIIRLEVPEDAKRCSATTNKCRCDKAKVIAIEKYDGTDSGLTEIVNENYVKCIYRVGEMVYPDWFDDNRWNECSHGIHFFINREDAVRYLG